MSPSGNRLWRVLRILGAASGPETGLRQLRPHTSWKDIGLRAIGEAEMWDWPLESDGGGWGWIPRPPQGADSIQGWISFAPPPPDSTD